MFSMPSLALIIGRLSVLMESLLLFSKTVLPQHNAAVTHSRLWCRDRGDGQKLSVGSSVRPKNTIGT